MNIRNDPASRPKRSLAAQQYLSGIQGRKVLVIGLSREVNRSVVNSLQGLGVAAQGNTQPESANQLFDARDFELIVFGRGVLGPISDRLKQAFAGQNPGVRFVDAFHPVAVEQTLAALAHDPRTPRFIGDFHVTQDQAGMRVSAEILAPCRIRLTLYRHTDDGMAPEILSDAQTQAGHFERAIDSSQLKDAHTLVICVVGEEYHLHPFLK